jgi:hypothetical protein
MKHRDEPMNDDDPGMVDNEAAVVDGLAAVLGVCQTLHEQRLALGLSLEQVAERSAGDAWAAEWVDEGDVSAPIEALVYYAAAVGLRLEVAVSAAVP